MNKTIILLAVLATAFWAPAHALSNKESIAAIEQRLARIEQLLQSQALLDMLQQLDALQQEVNQLRGEIEVQNHTLEQLNERQRALYTDIDQRIQSLDQKLEKGNRAPGVAIIGAQGTTATTAPDSPPLQTLAPATTDRQSAASGQTESPLVLELLDTAPAPGSPSAPVVNAASGSLTLEDAETLPGGASPAEQAAGALNAVIQSNPIQARADYQQAFGRLKQALYDQAIKAFKEFLATHPGSDYADNAQYWLGEAYYVTRQFDQALREYNKLVKNYPQSQKLTHALLKIGYSNQELGNVEQAQVLLEALKQNHPGTTAARLADDRLQKMRAAQPSGSAN